MKLFFAAVVMSFVGLAFSDCPKYAGSGWTENPVTGKCYKLFDEAETWENAENQCNFIDSRVHLVSINDADEGEALKSFISENGPRSTCDSNNRHPTYWIGWNNLLHTGWTWTDGSDHFYTNFKTFEVPTPTNKCSEMQGDTKRWERTDCHGTLRCYICSMFTS